MRTIDSKLISPFLKLYRTRDDVQRRCALTVMYCDYVYAHALDYLRADPRSLRAVIGRLLAITSIHFSR